MDREIVYPGAIPLDTDTLNAEKNTMVALGFLAQMVAGTGTVFDGLALSATSPASLSVNVGPGSILTLTTADATAFGSLASDSSPLVKMGINTGSVSFTCAAPTTSGQSINYLIEAEFLEADGTPLVLPYYNAANPATPYSGPSNSGAAQNTIRTERVSLQLKPGAAATTGTQTTPAVDSGWIGLYVVTVSYGQTTITSSNFSRYPASATANEQTGTGMRAGRFLNRHRFATAGTFAYTPTVGTNKIVVTVWGAGGGAAGCPATGASQYSAGAPGGGGAYAEKTITTGLNSISVVVGAGGAGGASGGNGSNGAISSLTTATISVQAYGGIGGTTSGPGALALVNGGAGGGLGTSGDINFAGNYGGTSFNIGSAGIFGQGGTGIEGLTIGAGAGGNGTVNEPSTAATSGMAGQPGIVIVDEYT